MHSLLISDTLYNLQSFSHSFYKVHFCTSCADHRCSHKPSAPKFPGYRFKHVLPGLKPLFCRRGCSVLPAFGLVNFGLLSLQSSCCAVAEPALLACQHDAQFLLIDVRLIWLLRCWPCFSFLSHNLPRSVSQPVHSSSYWTTSRCFIPASYLVSYCVALSSPLPHWLSSLMLWRITH